tara:strand:- start:365 stop:1093 length:729 start_codon:yes stop_codon:yes gene_type:complete
MELQQINDEGQALQSGLEVFVSIPVYSGEYLAYGNSFLLQTLTGATDTASSTTDYAAEVIASVPPSNVNQWYKYHTEGTSYPSVTAPSTSTNMLTMLGVYDGENLSHSGIYQKLSGLLVGFEYEVTINFHYSANVGVISFSRFYYANENFTTAIQTAVTTASLPSKQITFTFTAKTTNDIVFFDYETTEESTSCFISSIEIKEQNNYVMAVVADIPRGGISKVLRRRYNETIPLDEGETRER